METRREFIKNCIMCGSYLALRGFGTSESYAYAFKPNAESIHRGCTKQKKIALTFDGAQTNNSVPYILKSLKDKKYLSTFFLTGESIRKFPDVAKAIYDEGHEIGNHTYAHPHLTTYSENRKQTTRKGVNKNLIQNELSRTQEEFYKACRKDMFPLWRAPFGEENQEIREWAKETGYQHVRWTFDTLDWVNDEKDNLYISPKSVKQRLLNIDEKHKNGLNGYIILMHTGTERKKEPFYHELPVIMENLLDKGYTFGKVSEVCSIF